MRLRNELEKLKKSLGIVEEVLLSEEENKECRKILKENGTLPEGVFWLNKDAYPDCLVFYQIRKTDLTKEELAEYLEYEKLKTLLSIKKGVWYIVWLIISPIILYVFYLLIGIFLSNI